MKILLFSHTFLPNIGGREIVVHYLAKSLLEEGHEVHVFGPGSWWEHRHLRFGYPVHRLPTLVRGEGQHTFIGRRVREREWALGLRLICAWHDFDLIHAHTTYPAGYVATHYKVLGKRLPVVVTPHGVDIDSIPAINYGMRLERDLRVRIDEALCRADAVTAISKGIRRTLIDVGVPASKIADVENGVSVDRFCKCRDNSFRKSLGIPDDADLIVTVGNYHPRKGHRQLIECMKRIGPDVPKGYLVIVGRGSECLTEEIERWGVGAVVKLVGTLALPRMWGTAAADVTGDQSADQDLLVSLLRSACLYVSAGTTEGAEGLSLAVLEAMAAGLPIVATRITGNRDVVRHEETGLLVEPSNVPKMGEALKRVLTNPTEAKRMGRNARALVEERYNWTNVARKYVEIYKHVIQSNLGPN